MMDNNNYNSRFKQKASNLLSYTNSYIQNKNYNELAKNFCSNAQQNAYNLIYNSYNNGSNSNDINNEELETLTLFPGWAVLKSSVIKVQLSGYSSCLRSPQNATRSQRAFLKLAKSFAALPPLPNANNNSASNSDNLINVKDDEDLNQLDLTNQQLDQIEIELSNDANNQNNKSYQKTSSNASSNSQLSLENLQLMHNNLNRRLQPFWSSILPNRSIKLSVFAIWGTPLNLNDISHTNNNEPIATAQIKTNTQGHFDYIFNIKLDNIPRPPSITDPYQLPIELKLKVDLLPRILDYNVRPNYSLNSTDDYTATQSLHLKISSDRGLRVISDLDDTVRTTEILNGVRAMFKNVFVNDEKQMIIPDIVHWYNLMQSQGLSGFHYVSNSPFEAFNAIHDFFRASKLPHGHFKLKYYGGKSFLGGLWEPAAERKRSGIYEILNEFNQCQFILIGDSGEQDLELYTSLAKERPHQIVAIFIRDVTTPTDQYEKEIKSNIKNQKRTPPPVPSKASLGSTLSTIPSSQSTSKIPPPLPPKPQSLKPSPPPLPQRSQTSPNYIQPPPIRKKPSSMTIINTDYEPLEFETVDPNEAKLIKRVDNFLLRLDKAKNEIPPHIIFCVFKHASEVESITTALLVSQR